MPCSGPAAPHAGEPEKGVTITHILFAGRKAAALSCRAATTACLAGEIFRSAAETGGVHEKTAWQQPLWLPMTAVFMAVRKIRIALQH